MIHRCHRLFAATLLLSLGWTSALLAGVGPAGPHQWKPVADRVFLQEVGSQVRTEQPVTQVAVRAGRLYAVVGGSLLRLAGDRLEAVAGAPASVVRLVALDDALWASAADGTYRGDGTRWQRVDPRPMVDFCLHLGVVHAATRDDLFRFDGERFVNIKPKGGYLSSDLTVQMADGSQVLADPVRIGPIRRIASYSGTLYLLLDNRFALIDRTKFVPRPVDWGTLPSDRLRDQLAQGSRLYIATDRGLAVLRGMALTTLKGADGLPYEDTTCLAEGFDGDLWIGTTTGAIRKIGREYHYFGSHHWLPGDHVRAIAAGDRVVYIGTDAGLGIIRYVPWTLARKADYYQRQLARWHYQRLGFVHKLYWSGPEDGWLREISDNDGGHTAHYLAAMAFRYAVTHDEHARREALDAFKAMVWLESITPIDGFIARAIWSVKADKGQRAARGSGGLPAKWYATDDGLWQWKGDTSSDEVNGHFYAVHLFHDLVAQGPEKKRAAQHLARIAGHIIDNGWVLRDMDGKPTRWGRWDPDYLLRPYGWLSRGLNGMEAQAYMRTAYALTGDAKFQRGYEQLLAWGYHHYTVRVKLTFPPNVVVPWDDELAFRCYHPLLSHTEDPGMRSIYLRALERSWEVMRMQQVPFFNFIYGALTGNDCETEAAVAHLREWPVDTVSHSYRNAHRHDLAPRPGYTPYAGGTRALSPRETEAKWGSRSSIEYNGGSGGRIVTPPIGWLEDYWMGRYYGFIEPPSPDAAADEIPVPAAPDRGRAVAPYEGPPRPAHLIGP